MLRSAEWIRAWHTSDRLLSSDEDLGSLDWDEGFLGVFR
jgi:hypothetical protein